MIALGLSLLLGLAMYLGLTLRLTSLRGYYPAVALTLGIWTSSLVVWNTYTVMLPLLLGALGSLLLALAGFRAAWRAHRDGDGSRDLWIGGACAVLLPFPVLYLVL